MKVGTHGFYFRVLSFNCFQLFSILMWKEKHLSAAKLKMFQHETFISEAGGCGGGGAGEFAM